MKMLFLSALQKAQCMVLSVVQELSVTDINSTSQQIAQLG